MFDDPAQRESIEAALESFISEGLQGKATEKLANQFEKLVEVYWADRPLDERERIGALYRKAFGIEEKEADLLARPQGDFTKIVGSDGWFGDFLKYTEPAKAMPQLFFGAAIAFIAAGLGRQPRIKWSVEALYPNVYVLLIGNTGAGKGTAIKRTQKVVQGIVEPGLAPNILPDEGSQQGYAKALKRRFDETGEYADGLIIAEELRMLLSEDKYKAQLIVWLTAWYSKEGAWSRALSSDDPCYFENPCVSCLFASNMSWLRLTPSDIILGGFWPRFLKFHTPEHQMRWGEFDPEFDEDLATDLTRRLAKAYEHLPEIVDLTPEARAWACEWYKNELSELALNESHERIKDWYERCSAHVMKLACIWQFADGELHDKLELRYLKKAWRVLTWMRYTVHYMYGSIGISKNSTILVDVLEKLEASGGSMKGNKLVRALRNRYRAREVRAALVELEDGGDIIRKETARRGIEWRLVREEDS